MMLRRTECLGKRGVFRAVSQKYTFSVGSKLQIIDVAAAKNTFECANVHRHAFVLLHKCKGIILCIPFTCPEIDIQTAWIRTPCGLVLDIPIQITIPRPE